MRPVLRCFLVSLALAGLPAVPVLAAASPSPGGAATATSSVAGTDLAAQLRSWLRTIWPESGCTIDPSGQCGSAAPGPSAASSARQVRPASGCLIDPSGGCGPAAPAQRRPTGATKVRPASGCGIDPGGGCH